MFGVFQTTGWFLYCEWSPRLEGTFYCIWMQYPIVFIFFPVDIFIPPYTSMGSFWAMLRFICGRCVSSRSNIGLFGSLFMLGLSIYTGTGTGTGTEIAGRSGRVATA